jgi:hypothetical protein
VESEYGKGSTFSFILPRAGSSASWEKVFDTAIPGSTPRSHLAS